MTEPHTSLSEMVEQLRLVVEREVHGHNALELIHLPSAERLAAKTGEDRDQFAAIALTTIAASRRQVEVLADLHALLILLAARGDGPVREFLEGRA